VWSTDLFRDPAREIARILKVARDVPVPASGDDPSGGERPDASGTGEVSVPQTAVASGQHGSPMAGGASVEPVIAGQSGEVVPHESVPTPTPSPKRRRRRVFRKGTAEAAVEDSYGSTRDDTDSGWGERRESSSRDQWLQDQRPPHYE
jgi:hypothetical protein